MPDNFFVTAERMNDSAQVLHQHHLHHTACYLAGYVVECYMKLLIGKEPSLNRPTTYRHDIGKMNTDLSYAVTSGAAISVVRRYILDLALDCPSIFTRWNPNNRYDDTAGWDIGTSTNFQTERTKCFDKIIEMHLDSFIP